MPPQIIRSINQHITDGTLFLPFLQPTNQSKPDAAPHQPTPGSSTFLSSPLQHQANCLQAIHKTIQRFNQQLKAEHIDRQTLQFIVLQLQKDFAVLRYLLFSTVESTSNKDTAATSPLFNPNLILTLLHLPSPFPALVKPNFVVLPRWALWGHPKRKQTILQMPISSPHPTRSTLLQSRRRTSHQESPNSKNYLQMK